MLARCLSFSFPLLALASLHFNTVINVGNRHEKKIFAPRHVKASPRADAETNSERRGEGKRLPPEFDCVL